MADTALELRSGVANEELTSLAGLVKYLELAGALAQRAAESAPGALPHRV